MGKHASVIPTAGLADRRDVREVPFVELQGGRVQGVVSSGSDPQRVYVSFVQSRTGDYYCCTNNNRPCGGLRGAPCKHITEMVDEAIRQFGAAAVAAYLGVSRDVDQPQAARELLGLLRGSQRNESPGVVFSRFLSYLRYCELGPRPGTVLEMGWFVS
jgi:hypothetical protein